MEAMLAPLVERRMSIFLQNPTGRKKKARWILQCPAGILFSYSKERSLKLKNNPKFPAICGVMKMLSRAFVSLPVNGQILSLPARSKPWQRIKKARERRPQIVNKLVASAMS